jgi:hypothetical protein
MTVLTGARQKLSSLGRSCGRPNGERPSIFSKVLLRVGTVGSYRYLGVEVSCSGMQVDAAVQALSNRATHALRQRCIEIQLYNPGLRHELTTFGSLLGVRASTSGVSFSGEFGRLLFFIDRAEPFYCNIIACSVCVIAVDWLVSRLRIVYVLRRRWRLCYISRPCWRSSCSPPPLVRGWFQDAKAILGGAYRRPCIRSNPELHALSTSMHIQIRTKYVICNMEDVALGSFSRCSCRSSSTGPRSCWAWRPWGPRTRRSLRTSRACYSRTARTHLGGGRDQPGAADGRQRNQEGAGEII